MESIQNSDCSPSDSYAFGSISRQAPTVPKREDWFYYTDIGTDLLGEDGVFADELKKCLPSTSKLDRVMTCLVTSTCSRQGSKPAWPSSSECSWMSIPPRLLSSVISKLCFPLCQIQMGATANDDQKLLHNFHPHVKPNQIRFIWQNFLDIQIMFYIQHKIRMDLVDELEISTWYSQGFLDHVCGKNLIASVTVMGWNVAILKYWWYVRTAMNIFWN